MEVFLVDESPESRRRFASLIEAVPGAHLIGHAGTATAAIAAILEKKPDVVLVDVRLEKGTGFEVLQEVHAREPGIDFFVLSNYASAPYRRRALRLGAVDFFDKTTELDALRQLLAERSALMHPPVAPL